MTPRLLIVSTLCLLWTTITPAQEETDTRPTETSTPALQPLVLPAPPESAAPDWLSPFDGERFSLPDNAPIVARGENYGIVRPHEDLYVAVHRTDGVLQQLPIPEDSRWLGIDGDGAVVSLSKQGVLSIARDQQNFVPLTVLQGIQDIDITPTHVVAVSQNTLFRVNLADGTTASSQPLGKAQISLLEVAARADGVIVLRGQSGDTAKVWVGRRGRFKPASATLPRLQRDGGWIWNGDFDKPLILASDAKTWLSDVDLSPVREPVTYAELLATSDTGGATPHAPSITLTAPAAPRPDVEPPLPIGLVGTRGIGAGKVGVRCLGAFCVDYEPEVIQGTPGFALFSEGLCGPDDACAPESWTRAPGVAVIDFAGPALERRELPPDCIPRRLIDHGGLGILMCDAGPRVTVFTTTAAADAWKQEVELDAELVDAQWHMTPDGTLFAQRHFLCLEDTAYCTQAWVRQPQPSGDEGAWRVLAFENITQVIDVAHGAVLLVTALDAQSFRLYWSTSDEGTLLADVPLPEEGLLFEVALEPCLRVRIGTERESARWHVLSAAGTLLESETCEAAEEAYQRELDKGTLKVTCDTPDAKIKVGLEDAEDGDTLACPVEHRLEAGTYRVVAMAEDRKPFEQIVTIESRETTDLAVELRSPSYVAVRAYGGLPMGAPDSFLFKLDAVYLVDERAVDVGAFLRYVPGNAEDAFLFGVTSRVMGSFEDFDLGLALSMGWGALEALPEAVAIEDKTSNQKDGFRFFFGLRAAYLITDAFRLEAGLDLHISDPTVIDIMVGLSYAF